MRATTGYMLCKTTSDSTQVGLDILETLPKLRPLAHHPLLVPLLMHNKFHDIINRLNQTAAVQTRNIQQRLGLLDAYLGRAAGRDELDGFDEIHEHIILHHAYLTSAVAEFVQGLGPAFRTSFARLRPDSSTTGHLEHDLQDHIALVS